MRPPLNMKNERLRPKKKKKAVWGGRIKGREGRKRKKSQSKMEGVRGERGEETRIEEKKNRNKEKIKT